MLLAIQACNAHNNKLRQLVHNEVILSADKNQLDKAALVLILELLKNNKKAIARRKRIGASRHTPARPVGVP